MDFSRLSRDELEYELMARGKEGFAVETVLSMRRLLKKLAREENFGEIRTAENFQPDVTSEVDICNTKVVELGNYVNQHNFSSVNSTETRYVEAKLKHLYGRLNRLTPPNARLTNSIANLRNELDQVETTLHEKLGNDETAADENTATGAGTSVPATDNNPRSFRADPVYKWNFHFSGSKGSLSVNAFLEQVDEYRVARGVTEAELFNSVVDLLEGRAKNWYRSVRDTISSWAEFVTELKKEFLPHDFQAEFLEEIRKSHQGTYEPVGEFFARVTNMFNRLPKLIPEEEKLYIIRRILAPYYVDRLSLSEYRTVSGLKELCKKIEVSRDMSMKPKEKFCDRNRLSLLEPDLAYERPWDRRQSIGTKERVDRVDSIQCWNCKEAGHAFSVCRKPRSGYFCFRCGKQGVTKYKCTCSSKNVAHDRR